jgi:hypothetical protein
MRRFAVLFMSLCALTGFAARADAQQVVTPLISVDKNLQGKNVTISSKDMTPQSAVPWSVTMEVLHGGKQEGVRLLHVDNGKLKITLIPTRGLGVLAVQSGDLRLGWDSPVKEVVHPKHVNLASRGGLGWLEGFNEWMVRCGLENNGQAGPDRLTNNVGDTVVIDLPLHGKIANIPAQEVAVVVDKSPPHRITIRGSVQERMLFGPKLELATELSTEPGSPSFQIRDTVINRGGQTQEFQMLYHANFGKPLLEKGARLVAPLSEVTPYNANAAKDVKAYNTFREPTAGYVEQVYLLKPLADIEGRTRILLHNQAGDRGASMSYSLKQLPYLTLWKNTGAEPDGYVIGIEPGTNYPNRREVERKHGRVPKLAPGASYEMTIHFGVHVGKKDVRRMQESVAAIQGDAATKLNAMPQKLE